LERGRGKSGEGRNRLRQSCMHQIEHEVILPGGKTNHLSERKRKKEIPQDKIQRRYFSM